MRNWNSQGYLEASPGKFRVFILPMRNWNSRNVGRVGKITHSVFILPMRNWNQRIHLSFLDTLRRFHLTYEELKHAGTYLETTQVWVFILPMRNWNIYRCIKLLSSDFSFSSYLWGIETLAIGGQCWLIFRFHLTYEELKPGRLESRAVSDYDCFHLTYEELKRRTCRLYIELCQLVFILPMRNWNCNAHNGRILRHMFSSYLWGIETTMGSLHLYTRNPPFSSYLWGIETKAVLRQKRHSLDVFILPMRNWNITGSMSKQYGPAFSSYLWGIETCSIFSRISFAFFGFHLTYEELKPNRRKRRDFCSGNRFHLTYEELKQETAKIETQLNYVFILPMRNWNKCFFLFLRNFFQVFILPMRNWNFPA